MDNIPDLLLAAERELLHFLMRGNGGSVPAGYHDCHCQKMLKHLSKILQHAGGGEFVHFVCVSAGEVGAITEDGFEFVFLAAIFIHISAAFGEIACAVP